MKIAAAALAMAAFLPGQEAQQIFSMISGERIEGSIDSMDGDTLHIRRAGELVDLSLDELSQWQPRSMPELNPSSAGLNGELHSRDGLNLPCEVLDANQDMIQLRLAGIESPAKLSFRHLESLRFMALREDDSGFARALGNAPKSNDLLFAINRESQKLSRLSVIVQGFDGENVLVLFRDEVRPVPISQLYGLVFGAELGVRPPTQARPTVILESLAGHQLRGRLLDWDGKTCRLQLPEGAEIELACPRIRRFSVQSSKIEYLSDLSPRAEQVPAFDHLRPWLVDSAPRGSGLQLGGQEYSRGLCLIPRTRLTFDLSGQFDRFEAIIGIDDRSNREAHADFRVFLDEKLVFEAKGVRHGQAGQGLRIPLAGASSLILETDFGENFDLGDHCLFADARLLKN